MEDTFQIKRKKVVFHPFPPRVKANNHRFLVIDVPVFDEKHASIDELSIEIMQSQGIKKEAKFTLFIRRDEKRRERLFQIEVYPNKVNSHRFSDGTHHKGPHIHLLDSFNKCYPSNDANLHNIDYWLNRFARHINLKVVSTESQLEIFSGYDHEL